jgi:hypothetical protein
MVPEINATAITITNPAIAGLFISCPPFPSSLNVGIQTHENIETQLFRKVPEPEANVAEKVGLASEGQAVIG